MKAFINSLERKMIGLKLASGRGVARMKKLVKNEEGAEGIEWSTVLIVAVPIIAIIVAIGALFAEEIQKIFDYFSNFFADGGPGDVMPDGGVLPPS